MNKNHNKIRLLLLAVVGVFISVLVFLFHSETGQFEILVNGQPVSEPLLLIGVIPAIFVVLSGTAVLMLMTFFGVGMMVFLAGVFFLLFGIFLFIPFAWPVLIFIFLIIFILFFEDGGNEL